MIEPYVSDRQCKRCLYCRKGSEFTGRRRICASCREARPEPQPTRTCSACTVTYPLTAFYARSYKCKACARQANRQRNGWKPRVVVEEQPWPTQPGDPRSPIQRDLAAVQARWEYPVERADLKWMLAA